jgi:hypothetical protein
MIIGRVRSTLSFFKSCTRIFEGASRYIGYKSFREVSIRL